MGSEMATNTSLNQGSIGQHRLSLAWAVQRAPGSLDFLGPRMLGATLSSLRVMMRVTCVTATSLGLNRVPGAPGKS